MNTNTNPETSVTKGATATVERSKPQNIYNAAEPKWIDIIDMDRNQLADYAINLLAQRDGLRAASRSLIEERDELLAALKLYGMMPDHQWRENVREAAIANAEMESK